MVVISTYITISRCSRNAASPILTFTGKERDAETGYSYFGARYYDSDLSGLFLSVDPMSDKYPSFSPYAYCAWNPLKLVDNDGKSIEDPPSKWKTIKPVIRKSDAIVWGDLYSRNCFDYAKQQLFMAGCESNSLFCSGLYDEQKDVSNKEKVLKSVDYINKQLEKGNPVMVGIDCKPGYQKENGDKSTDHFIVIVGRGNDDNGNYFTFYDNAAGNKNNAASPDNKLYFNDETGLIRGKPCRGVSYAYRGDHDNRQYTVTQVWATKKRKEDE